MAARSCPGQLVFININKHVPGLTESGEGDKLNGEPLRKDAETMVSIERLHMITRFNPLGSLHSLSRGSRARVSCSF